MENYIINKCMISFRTEFNLRKTKNLLLHLCDFSSPPAHNTYSFSSARKEINIFHCGSSGADASTDCGNIIGRCLCLRKDYLFMLQFTISLFCTEKNEQESKFSSHLLYKSQPSGNLRSTTTSYQFSSLWYKDITIRGCLSLTY